MKTPELRELGSGLADSGWSRTKEARGSKKRMWEKRKHFKGKSVFIFPNLVFKCHFLLFLSSCVLDAPPMNNSKSLFLLLS